LSGFGPAFESADHPRQGLSIRHGKTGRETEAADHVIRLVFEQDTTLMGDMETVPDAPFWQ
jgi:hypothetical protein